MRNRKILSLIESIFFIAIYSFVNKKQIQESSNLFFINYAEGRGRTGTPVKEPDFESGASAYSATSATDFSQIENVFELG